MQLALLNCLEGPNNKEVDGNFTERLGAGNWRIKISTYQSSYLCATEFDLAVQAGKTTRACIDMACAAP